MQSTEEWRAVVGYEGRYEVSNLGRVRSLPRTYLRHGYPVTVHGKPMDGSPFKGYLQVRLSANGSSALAFIHQLVARAFLGVPGAGQEVCHGDGTRDNNRVDNLRWGTRSDNMQDALAHGTHRNASKEFCVRGHELNAGNTRLAKDGEMRVCIKCRKRKVPCPVCSEMRSYYGMKSHLQWKHDIRIEGRSWQMAFQPTSAH